MPDINDGMANALATSPGAETVPYPDGGSQILQVGGKHCGRLGSDPAGHRIVTVKGDPDADAALVQEFEVVTPGHYANRRLWISLALDADGLREVIVEAIRTDYGIGRASLSRRVQAGLGGQAFARR